MSTILFLDGLARRSESTRVTYRCGLDAFARCFNVESTDSVVNSIKTGQLEPYETLDKFVSWLLNQRFAPKTVRTYLGAVVMLLEHEGLELNSRKLRRIELPPNTEISIDRIPTRDELRKLILNSNPRARALIALLSTSGLRIGEAGNLRIGNLELLSNKIVVLGNKSKSRRTRTTFITDETAGFIREYLGSRVNNKDEWLFPDDVDSSNPAGRRALYMLVYRLLDKLGLREKLDPDSRMYELHPHAFRKYFFTKLIGAGVDRGVAEYLMGHRFGLDNSYLRMDEQHLRKEYMKAEKDFIFLIERVPETDSQIEAMAKKNEELRQRITQLEAQNKAAKLSDEEIIAVKQLIAGKNLTS